MKYYPLFLDIRGRRCLVVGAGAVATRKAQSLLAAGAEVTVVGEKPAAALRKLAGQGKVALRERRCRLSDIGSWALAVVATDDREVNRALSERCRRRGIPVNVVDDPELSNFIVPALYHRKDLTIAVSTAGSSPALARRLREELGRRYRSWADLAEVLGEHRTMVMEKIGEGRRRSRLWHSLLDEEGIVSLLALGKRSMAKAVRRKIDAEAQKEDGR